MIRLSCSVKLYAFNVAEQFDRKNVLGKFYTIYHSQKDFITAAFNARKDTERIGLDRIQTFPYLAPLTKFRNDPYSTNVLFDSLVTKHLKKDKDYSIFIGWSGMSLRSMKQAKQDGKKVLLERSSSHIRFQFELLKDEYARWGYLFKGDERVAEQEEREYELADYVVIPSSFVEKTFQNHKFSLDKIFKNNFGSNSYFKPTKPKRQKFTILYVGNLSLRKGLPYLFKALAALDIDPLLFDVWFIGSLTKEVRRIIPKYQRPNWKFFGHVTQYDLADLVSQCSVAVQPSLEEGLSMVIPQLMCCGTPVIATTNTGAEDIIQDGINGFIVPIRSPETIAKRLTTLFFNPGTLSNLQKEAIAYGAKFGTWDQYGDRYVNFIRKIIP
jgi:glycosyltransferase involved in cell wall biosynthesis